MAKIYNFKKIILNSILLLLVLCSFWIIIFPIKASADYGWTTQINSGLRNWSSVAYSGDGTKIAVTTLNGYIYTSDDDGATWIEQQGSGQHSWTSITSSADGTKLAAVTSSGYIYTSIDGGITWTEQINSGSRGWASITSSADGTKLAAVTSSGYIYTSIDGGITWTEQTNSGSRGWTSITSSSDGVSLAATVGGGYIYTSDDSGLNWEEQDLSGSRSWMSITSSSDGIKLAAADYGGYIYFSEDGGVTWSAETSISNRFTSITASSDLEKLAVVAVGYGSPYDYIYTSSDNGNTWFKQIIPPRQEWKSISMSADGTKIAAVGRFNSYVYTYGPITIPIEIINDTTIITSNDSAFLNGYINTDSTIRGFEYGLDTSYGQTTIETGSFNMGSFSATISSLIPGTLYHYRAYATNSSGTSYSEDASFIFNYQNWIEQTNSGSRNWSSVASSSDGMELVATVRGGYIYTSVDGGTTWIEQTNSGSRNWSSVASSSDGMKLSATVLGGHIYTSVDGGTTWIDRTNSGSRNWTSIASSSDGMKLAATAGGYSGSYIYTSINGGDTWTTQTGSGVRDWSSITSSSDGTKLAAAANYNNGCCSQGYIYLSSDSGVTWSRQTNLGSQNWNYVSSSADGQKLVADYNNSGYIYTSVDRGSNWTQQTDAGNRSWKQVTSSADGTKLTIIINNTSSYVYSTNYIYTSGDSGDNWTRQNSAIPTTWQAVASSADGTRVIAAVKDGYIYTSTPLGIPTVTTEPASLVNSYSAVLNGSISDIGGELATVRGFEYGLDTSYGSTTIENGQFNVGTFDSNISSLISETTYHYRSYSINSFGINYGQDQSFTTTQTPPAPTMSTELASDITITTAILNGTIISTGGEDVNQRGFEYGLDLTYGSTLTEDGFFGEEPYTAHIESLSPNTTYYFRSYSINGGGIGYGEDQTFTTLPIVPPTVETYPESSVNLTSSTLNGAILETEGSNATTRGFEYGLSIDYDHSTSEAGSFEDDVFYVNLNGLTPNSTYHYRAYAVNSAGIGYGQDRTFTTNERGWVENKNIYPLYWWAMSSSSDGTKLAITGMPGYIYTSTDKGSTWTKQESSGEKYWSTITSSSDGTKLAAGIGYWGSGYIYTSVNSGITWTAQTNSGSRQWASITSSSDGTKLAAVPSSGYVYTSIDGGVTWVEQIGSGTHYWKSIASSADGLKLAAVDAGSYPDYNGYIYTSIDGGVNWTEQIGSGLENWISITSSSDGTKLAAVPSSGYIYTSIDGGVTWTEQTGSGSRDWISVSSSSDGIKIAAASSSSYYNSYIYVSTNGGVSWTTQTDIGVHRWSSVVSSADGLELNAIVNRGYFYHYGPITEIPIVTTDTPIAKDSGTITLRGYINTKSTIRGFEYGSDKNYGNIITQTGMFNVGSFSSDLYIEPNTLYHYRAFAVNSLGTSYSDDSTFILQYQNWVQQASNEYSNIDWFGITSSADGSKVVAFLGGDGHYGNVYTSGDKGVTWTKLNSISGLWWQAITSSADGSRLAIVDTADGYIYTSSDGGVTWITQTKAGRRKWASIASSTDGLNLIAGVSYASDTGYLYTSTDGGVNWTERTLAGSRNWYSVASSSDGLKLAAVDSNNGYIYTSIDGGVTWVEQTGSGTHYWKSITSSADGMRLAAVDAGDYNNYGGYVYTSTDGGINWTENISSGLRYWRYIDSSADGLKLVAVNQTTQDNNYGYIYSSIDGGITWTEQRSAGSHDWRSITSSADGEVLAAAPRYENIHTVIPSSIPTLITKSASSIKGSSATLKGTIYQTGWQNPTVRGFEYGLDTSYGSITTENGSFTAVSFVTNISSLTCDTVYHYRSYATNSVGTGYGEDKIFKTSSCSTGGVGLIIDDVLTMNQINNEPCKLGDLFNSNNGLPCPLMKNIPEDQEISLLTSNSQKPSFNNKLSTRPAGTTQEVLIEFQKEQLRITNQNMENSGQIESNIQSSKGLENGFLLSNDKNYANNGKVLGVIIDKTQEIFEDPTTRVSTESVSVLGVTTAAVSGFSTLLFAGPITFSEILFVPGRIWMLVLIFFGLKKKKNTWGTVYDSVTKQPLDPAYVTLESLDGREVATCITDIDGRYGFLAPSGSYRLKVSKTHYHFPSEKLSSRTSDEIYDNLYFNEVINVTEENVIKNNIPMDPLKFDWNEFAKKDQKKMKFYSKKEIFLEKISKAIFIIGFILSIILTLIKPSMVNIIITVFYILTFILGKTILKPRLYGSVFKKGTSEPLSFAIIRIFSKDNFSEVAKKVTTQTGKYYCLISNGYYSIKIEEKNPDESYTNVYNSEEVIVKNGYLNKRFEI